MNDALQAFILKSTGASHVKEAEVIQSLWSGYGELYRVMLSGASISSVIVKHVAYPKAPAHHPRGWHSDIGHQRKLKSYQVETHWYPQFSKVCNEKCYCPAYLGSTESTNELILILEDLTPNFPVTPESIDLPQVETVLTWLANFHARFMQKPADQLWPIGCYWHLATRSEEWHAMPEGQLKDAATDIDRQLNSARFQTLVHGDAKLANFCFSETGDQVAAVDFQYVGGGVGVRDVAYFLSSCLTDDDCFRFEERLLGVYFNALTRALSETLSATELSELVAEWRALYPVCWADFQRFLEGWSPGHWKLGAYCDHQTQQVLTMITDEAP